MLLKEAVSVALPKTLLVVDVESTCWKTKEEQGDQKNEIIEIGFCPVVDDKVGRKGNIFIKPQFSTLSKFCTELTTITDKELKRGLKPEQAYNRLKPLFNSNHWASWGNYDRKQFERMFQLYNIPNILPRNHINLRALFAKNVLKSSDPYTAPNNPADALKNLKMGFVGVNHRGDDDAFNIARLYVNIKN